MSSFKSGFIAVVGRPNVGKSTLLNSLLKQKLLIVSDKPQATRNRIQCILTTPEFQAVFLDTPGIHKPKHQLGERMVQYARNSLRDVDLILFIVEAGKKAGRGDKYIADLVSKASAPVFLLVNKIDAVPKNEILPLLHEWSSSYDFAEYIPISAKHGEGLDLLEGLIGESLPEGPKYYPDDVITDQPERFVIAEMIRERVFAYTRQEVPHSVAVYISVMEDRGSIVYIAADIIVERESQRGIVIGKQGQRLKSIGEQARSEIEGLLGCKVYLDLFVKSRTDWRNKQELLNQYGYARE